ncbi:MAG: hypothetical protein BA863_07835 [Desulfovibrio sp. S3730MH75]|nr:MAG: hypothetical protein BA863_07835 [Desulfovibrio sp. S3730MH75]
MISAEELTYSVGSFGINVSLKIEDGEYFVLLGSTGSGKTLFVENLCGLRKAASGLVFVDDSDVTDVEPRERGIGYVPQDGALFTHMNVSKNITFSLRVRHVSKQKQEKEITKIAELLGVEYLLKRRIPGLSGGEQQRVALARAIISRPRVLILDEPVSALDEYTKESICRKLKSVQRKLSFSVIHVCHSLEEARFVADRVGIMQQGRIVQTGTVDELLDAPANTHVANILRHENIFSGHATTVDNQGKITCRDVTLKGPPAEGDVWFIIRPWQIQLANQNEKVSVNSIEGTIVEMDCTGPVARLKINDALPIVFYLSRSEAEKSNLAIGSFVQVTIPPSAIHILGDRSKMA